MELVWLVYFISMLDSIIPVIGLTIACCILYIIGLTIYKDVECSDSDYYTGQALERRKVKRDAADKALKKTFTILVVAVIMTVVIPSKKTAYIMVGAYVAQRIAESGEIKDVGTKVYQLINKQLDSYLAEEVKDSK
jgi:hypothetical protein